VKLVLDSSVLIAAFARPGVCTQLLDEVVASHKLFCSDYIVNEVSRKLREKFGIPHSIVSEIVKDLKSLAQFIEPLTIAKEVCRDPKDLPVLGTAAACGAQYLITVDKDLLAIGEYQGVVIIKPGDFWRHWRAKGPS